MPPAYVGRSEGGQGDPATHHMSFRWGVCSPMRQAVPPTGSAVNWNRPWNRTFHDYTRERAPHCAQAAIYQIKTAHGSPPGLLELTHILRGMLARSDFRCCCSRAEVSGRGQDFRNTTPTRTPVVNHSMRQTCRVTDFAAFGAMPRSRTASHLPGRWGTQVLHRIEAARKARCQSKKSLSGMNERRIRTGTHFGSC